MNRIFCIGEMLIGFIPLQKETALQHVLISAKRR
ncbi:fructokinase [Bacillus licheniformis]|nr:fructokinase [Bacillus licheniformis]APJ28998.1 fructokinase [Bacillus sp. H15-1]ASV17460.1 fructokinase [Bacillus sp. 1s-1]EQM25595.1 hypothetical protein N399_22655 [Bacillus licheniformis CG-B52]KUL12069.1 hypothetical protein LI17339_04395 [Bacillus licheniformis LMG 17339]MBY8348524.1 fructokinase [Bacillus sp. PCH94]NBB43937.1 fructokinase [Bacillus sp. y1(2019)]OPG90982.1 fructokinase [Chryseobacterium mucoviscidosis]